MVDYYFNFRMCLQKPKHTQYFSVTQPSSLTLHNVTSLTPASVSKNIRCLFVIFLEKRASLWKNYNKSRSENFDNGNYSASQQEHFFVLRQHKDTLCYNRRKCRGHDSSSLLSGFKKFRVGVWCCPPETLYIATLCVPQAAARFLDLLDDSSSKNYQTYLLLP